MFGQRAGQLLPRRAVNKAVMYIIDTAVKQALLFEQCPLPGSHDFINGLVMLQCNFPDTANGEPGLHKYCE